jgi:site-specific recombinase XerD
MLCNLDRFLVEQDLKEVGLPRSFLDQWTARKEYERPTSQAYRLSLAREFSKFLTRREVPAFVPFTKITSPVSLDFVPYIFSKEEIRKIFAAADNLPQTQLSPLRHLVFPELFRLLYSCGLRGGEALKLTVSDVDLQEGVLRIRQTKFRKDRFVPMASSLTSRLREFSKKIGKRGKDKAFFPSRESAQYRGMAVYSTFRRLLWDAGIPHGGRGQGPRVHDLRHSFAVHRLLQWYEEGADLNAKLPILATYMGHVGLEGTQRYLRLTEAMFPHISSRIEAAFGHVIPGED